MGIAGQLCFFVTAAPAFLKVSYSAQSLQEMLHQLRALGTSDINRTNTPPYRDLNFLDKTKKKKPQQILQVKR